LSNWTSRLVCASVPRMTGQDRKPTYSAERAANVVLGMSILAAGICVVAGGFQIRDGSTTGWLLVVVGLLPLIGALLVRSSVLRPPRD
jgi:uncharacterized membrane protein HdeD (DUF308 family)